MFSLLYILYYSLLYKKETRAVTGFLQRKGMEEGRAKNLAFLIFLAQFLAGRVLIDAFLTHQLPF